MGTVKNKEKRIFVFVESDLRWKFFKRFHKSLNALGYEVVYITTCLTVWIRGKIEGYNVIISDLKKCKSDVSYESIKKEILDVESGDISIDEAAMLLTKWEKFFCEIASKHEPEVCFVYNGTSIFTYAAKRWAKKHKVKTLFFELANIDGKMFIDPWGTNAKSKLYDDDTVLKKYENVKKDYVEWLDGYRQKQRTVKQAFVSKKTTNMICFAINYVWFSNYLDNKTVYIGKGVKKLLYKYKPNKVLDNRVLRKQIDELKPYYLFPMQVTVDSQVLLNSDISLRQAIEYVKDKSRFDGVNLLIKMHPAERDGRINKKLVSVKSDNVFLLGNEFTLIDLIDNAEKIITINSTMGLEAILHGRNVEFLGKSIYKHFLGDDNELLNSYIMNYLIDIDYFSSKDIDESIVDRCLKRACL